MKLRGISQAEWNELFKYTSTKKYPAGSVIFFQGSEVGEQYILREGSCRISHMTEGGGLEKTFSIACGASMLCASAHICKLKTYPVTAVAYTDVVVETAKWEDVYRYFSDRPPFMFFLLKCISGELVGTYNQVSDSDSDIKYRVARFLTLQTHYGMMVYQDYTRETEISYSQETIASVLGVSRPSVNQALQELEGLGLIYKEYKKIRIVSIEKLVEYCEHFEEKN